MCEYAKLFCVCNTNEGLQLNFINISGILIEKMSFDHTAQSLFSCDGAQVISILALYLTWKEVDEPYR